MLSHWNGRNWFDGFNGGVTWLVGCKRVPGSPKPRLGYSRCMALSTGAFAMLMCCRVGFRHNLPLGGRRERVLIWPATTKYRETQRDPYAQILDFMRQSLRPPMRSEVVLTICGYAFGDFSHQH